MSQPRDMVRMPTPQELVDSIEGRLHCASAYQPGRDGFLTECNLTPLAQVIVPRYFFPELSRFFVSGRMDGRRAYVLIEESQPRRVWKTWIDPTSRHIVRFEDPRRSCSPVTATS
jgi:hypothetical protein